MLHSQGLHSTLVHNKEPCSWGLLSYTRLHFVNEGPRWGMNVSPGWCANGWHEWRSWMGCKRSPDYTRLTEGPSWCNSDVWCDKCGGQVWVLGTSVVRKKGIGGGGSSRGSSLLSHWGSGLGGTNPGMNWIGMDPFLMNSEIQHIMTTKTAGIAIAKWCSHLAFTWICALWPHHLRDGNSSPNYCH